MPGLVSPAVRCGGLVRRFGERVALAGVDLEVAAGRGGAADRPNGAGKTTLLRVLATVLRPTAGEVAVAGHALPREATRARPRSATSATSRWSTRADRPREPRAVRRAVRRRRRTRSARRSSWWGSAAAATTRPPSSRAACASGWRSRGRRCTNPACCCWTSRPPASTTTAAACCVDVLERHRGAPR